MHQPAHFIEQDLPILHALIGMHPLGLLILAGAEDIAANPFPFLLDENTLNYGKLRAHLA